MALVAALTLQGRAADESKKMYNLPGGDAATRLRQFSEISGKEILFAADAVRGITTHAVSGDLTAQQAIAQLLTGTGLRVIVDASTGAFAVRKEAAKVSTSTPTAQAGSAAAPKEGAVRLEKYEVLGTRIRQSDISGPSPVSTFTADTIEASGALTLSDFLATVPQTYGGISVGRNSSPNDLNLTFGQRSETTVPLAPNPGSSPTATAPGQTGVSGVGLRSLGAGSTLVLVDGQRMVQSPSGNRDTASGQGFVDINLIPLGLIDHIEIITDGASAIYGSDAVAGVINIVLKKNWSGAELSTSVKTTQHGGGNEMQSTLVVGFSGLKGKLHGTVAVNYYDRDSMLASQRSFSSNPNHSAIIKGYNPTTGAPVYGYDLRIQYGYPATVQAVGGTVSGQFNAIPGVSYVVTPSGSATTPALSAFIPKTTLPAGQTILSAQGQNNLNEAPWIELVPWSSRHGFLGNFTYTLSPQVEAYGSAGFNDTRGIASTMIQYVTPSSLYSVPAAYNPFNQTVYVGMALPKFGPITQRTHTVDQNVTVGLRGKFGDTWQWDMSGRWDRQVLNQMNRNFNTGAFTADLANGTFNPFIDANASGAPDQSALYESLAIYPHIDASSSLKAFSFDTSGDLFPLPGGPVKMALGGSAENDYDLNTSVAVSAAVTPVSTPTTYVTNQVIDAVYGELSIPVFGKPNAAPLLNKLDFNLADRYEYQNLGAGGKAVPKYGATWSPVQSVLVRGSYSEGWRAPSPTENRAVTQVLVTTAADPSRGNVLSTFNVNRGINPNLKPETSNTTFLGLVLDPPFVKGLSLSVNYYKTVQNDAIQSITSTTVLNNPTLFPTHIVRAPQTAADIAANQPGALISVDQFLENFGSVRNDSIDYGAEYSLPWQRLGRWRVTFDASHTLKAVRQLTPGVAPIDDVGDTYGGPRWKATGGVYWSSGNWNASSLVTYLSGFSSNLADVNYLAWNQSVPAVEKVDVLLGYRFKKGIWRGYGKNLQISVGISNLFDKKPPFSDTIYSFDPALHSDYIDGRTFQTSIKIPL